MLGEEPFKFCSLFQMQAVLATVVLIMPEALMTTACMSACSFTEYSMLCQGGSWGIVQPENSGSSVSNVFSICSGMVRMSARTAMKL